MEIACFADVHGNRVALEAVLDEMQSRAPDLIVFLGDLAGTGPEPRGCIEVLSSIDVASVLGNSDAWFLAPRFQVNSTRDQRWLEDIEWWCRQQLADADLSLLGGFDRQIVVRESTSSIYFCHGSPRSFDDEILPDTAESVLDQWLAGIDANILVAGHTHVPMLRRHRSTCIVNPGSVGLPFVITGDNRVWNPGWAEYAWIEVKDDSLRVTFDKVRYPVETLREATLASGMPHAEWWLSDRY